MPADLEGVVQAPGHAQRFAERQPRGDPVGRECPCLPERLDRAGVLTGEQLAVYTQAQNEVIEQNETFKQLRQAHN